MKYRCAFLLVIALSMPSLAAHPFHFTWTEIDYHRPSQSLRVQVELIADVFAEALSDQAKRKLEAEQLITSNDPAITQLIITYLTQRFRLKERTGKVVGLTMQRRSRKADMIIIHLRGKTTAGLDGVEMQNTILSESDPDQVNYVVVRHRGTENKLTFQDDKLQPLLSRPKSK